jgi:hypothetical protein
VEWRGGVLTSAVIWCTEHSDERPVVPELIAVLDDHVGAADKVHVVPCEELVDDRLAEAVAHPALVILPVERGVGRVGPEEVIQEAVVGHVRRPLDPPDVLHGVQRGREPAVDAEDLRRDDGRDGEAVEDVDERLPRLDITASLAFVIEAVYCLMFRQLT